VDNRGSTSASGITWGEDVAVPDSTGGARSMDGAAALWLGGSWTKPPLLDEERHLGRLLRQLP
jgi:hypothetical protein